MDKRQAVWSIYPARFFYIIKMYSRLQTPDCDISQKIKVMVLTLWNHDFSRCNKRSVVTIHLSHSVRSSHIHTHTTDAVNWTWFVIHLMHSTYCWNKYDYVNVSCWLTHDMTRTRGRLKCDLRRICLPTNCRQRAEFGKYWNKYQMPASW